MPTAVINSYWSYVLDEYLIKTEQYKTGNVYLPLPVPDHLLHSRFFLWALLKAKQFVLQYNI